MDYGRLYKAELNRIERTRLGIRLRQARLKAGQTQRNAAVILRTSTQTVRNWEAGRYKPPTWAISQLAYFYATPEQELLEPDDLEFFPPSQPLRYNRVLADPLKLADARQGMGLTLSEVAYYTGVSVSSIRRYENGSANPRADTMETLAAVYGMPIEWFTSPDYFTYEEPSHPLRPATGSRPPGPHSDIVLQVYEEAKEDLSPEDEIRIANFIHFIHNRQPGGSPAR